MNGERSGPVVWSSAAWRESALAWADEHLAAAGMVRAGEVEQPHLRAWATALRIPTTHGVVWLKAAAPGTAREAGLYELLHATAPERVLEPIAIDTHRGWMLLPDGGAVLGGRLDGPALASALGVILARYAELQRGLEPHVDTILALGVADMRPASMPRRYDEALEAVRPWADAAGEAARATYERIGRFRDRFGEWCARLAEAPGAASLDHNDLHPWNMFVPDVERPDAVRFYDWGDSVVAHPFACLLVPLGWVQRELSVGDGHPEVSRVRDAYLRVYEDVAPHAALVATVELACRVAKVARTLTWSRAVALMAQVPTEDDERFAAAPFDTLASVLDGSYLGGS